MAGFVAFCELVALTVSAGPAAAFVSATMLAVQVLTARCMRGSLQPAAGSPDDRAVLNA